MPKVEHQDATALSVLSDEELRTLDAHWRAANYLAVGQIYLLANPLLTEPLTPAHIKPRLLGHWGTSPGLNLVYTHLNRVIKARGLDALCVWGPGHGGPAVLANSWLEGTYSETYPDVSRDAAGMELLFKQFSFPGGVPSHVAPEHPGSIHEGGELGYSLAHAYGAAFDNPDLLVACVIGDGEAETGPLAAAWHSNKFLDPVHDGAVLPILHLNGYKIANPTVLSRLPESELDELAGILRRADPRHRRRPGPGAPGDGQGFRPGTGPYRGDAADGPRGRRRRTRALARDRAAHPEGLDRPRRGRRRPRRRHLARTPGPAGGGARKPRTPGAVGGVAALVPARGALPHGRPARCGSSSPCPRRHEAARCHPARQRRAPRPRPPHPLPGRLRGAGREAGHHPARADAALSATFSKKSCTTPRRAATSVSSAPTKPPPTVSRPSSTPAARPGRPSTCRSTNTWTGTAASWRSSPNTPARAGWRATR